MSEVQFLPPPPTIRLLARQDFLAISLNVPENVPVAQATSGILIEDALDSRSRSRFHSSSTVRFRTERCLGVAAVKWKYDDAEQAAAADERRDAARWLAPAVSAARG